jgi:hypothetical protein
VIFIWSHWRSDVAINLSKSLAYYNCGTNVSKSDYPKIFPWVLSFNFFLYQISAFNPPLLVISRTVPALTPWHVRQLQRWCYGAFTTLPLFLGAARRYCPHEPHTAPPLLAAGFSKPLLTLGFYSDIMRRTLNASQKCIRFDAVWSQRDLLFIHIAFRFGYPSVNNLLMQA